MKETKSSYHTEAHISAWKADWSMYAEGYAKAAELLVSNVNRPDRDQIVYPVVYLYRHAIELALKYTFQRIERYFQRVTTPLQGHSLLNLWAKVKAQIQELWSDRYNKKIREIDLCLRMLERNDPQSASFRYPVFKNGEKTIKSPETIDLVAFCAECRSTFDFLDGVCMEMDHRLSTAAGHQGEEL